MCSLSFTITSLFLIAIGISNGDALRVQRTIRNEAQGRLQNFLLLSHEETTKLAHHHASRRKLEMRRNAGGKLIKKNSRLSNRQNELSPSPTPSKKPKPLGYTFDPCFSNDDCSGGGENMQCMDGHDIVSPCSTFGETCFCLYIIPEKDYARYNVTRTGINHWHPVYRFELCETCTDCLNYANETCQVHEADQDSPPVCISTYVVFEGITLEKGCNTYPDAEPFSKSNNLESYINNGSVMTHRPSVTPRISPTSIPSQSGAPPQPSPQDGNKCIDAGLLEHLHPSQLVFPTHRKATVLCDEFNSCATPGHMLKYRGVAMSMKTYCSSFQHRCSKRVMHVNSPKFSRGLRVNSLTTDLQFTSFSAAYGSKVEEFALKQVIHLGF